MTYQEYRNQEQKAFNELPIFWAFGEEQFKEQMEKRGLTINDTDKIYSFGGGGYYLRSDADVVKAFFVRPNKLKELMQDTKFAESAFYYEMGNHEYHINWQADWDVCSCFGDCEYSDEKTYVDYLREEGYGAEVVESFRRAKKQFLQDADEKGWY